MNNFIKNLAFYYSQENDISNITCIMCSVNDDFKSLFLKFFFPNIDIAEVLSIRREVSDEKNEGSRVDLFISMCSESKPYIIEVKKGDRNHHFGQYESAYDISKERFGYITNYDCVEGKNLGYDVKTWEQFYDYLKTISTDDIMILGYMEYIKETCGLIKYDKTMNFKGISSIKCFADTAKKIITTGIEGIEIKKDRQYCYENSLHQSLYFRFNQNNEIWGYAVLGLWFNEEPVITVGINSRPELSNKILADSETDWSSFNFLSKPYRDQFWNKDDVWFELNDQKMKEFNYAETYNQQVEIISLFLKEVITYLNKFY